MRFLTQEIGSIAKPNWLVKKQRGKKLTEDDWSELNYWMEFGQIKDWQELKELLAKETLSDEDKMRLVRWASILVIRCLEKVGLDIIYDGEQHRSEMYQEPISYIEGFEFLGTVRSFDNKYYLKAAAVGCPRLKRYYHLDEFNFIKSQTTKPLKVPITGPYTLMNWSFNEFYQRKWLKRERDKPKAIWEANRELAMELARQIIQPNIESLIRAGARIIQIDEPAATTKPKEIGIFVDAFNQATAEIKECKFTLHICFSNYALLYPEILNLKNCSQYTFEFANKGGSYEFLKLMKKNRDEREVGLGVIDVHTDDLETPEIVLERIKEAVKIIEPERIYINPDCGLRTRSWRVAFAKLSNMVKGAELARKRL